MDDDGIVRGPAFDSINFGDGFGVERVCGQAVNGFRRQRDDFARAQGLGGDLHRGLEQFGGVGGENPGGHAGNPPGPDGAGAGPGGSRARSVQSWDLTG